MAIANQLELLRVMTGASIRDNRLRALLEELLAEAAARQRHAKPSAPVPSENEQECAICGGSASLKWALAARMGSELLQADSMLSTR
jgi:hypothetical protein